MMPLLVDLDDAPPNERAALWSETIRDAYLDVDTRFSGIQYPTGKIVRSWAGPISVSALSSVAQSHERTQAMATGDNVDWLVATIQFRGQSHLIQNNRDVCLSPGKLVIFDASEAFHIDFIDEHSILFLTLPRIFFKAHEKRKNDLLNVCVDERHGSTLIVDYFQRIVRSAPELSLEQQGRMTALGITLLVDAAAASAGFDHAPSARPIAELLR